jgi:hypothetical protein
VLVHRQDVAQAAIERSLLIDRCTACGFVDELHHLDANSNGMWMSAVEQARPQITDDVENMSAR